MIPRFLLPTLLALLAVLIVTCAVLMGGYGIAAAVGDATGAQVLWWIAMSCIILLVIDCLLLVAALAILHIDPARIGQAHLRRDRDQGHLRLGAD